MRTYMKYKQGKKWDVYRIDLYRKRSGVYGTQFKYRSDFTHIASFNTKEPAQELVEFLK